MAYRDFPVSGAAVTSVDLRFLCDLPAYKVTKPYYFSGPLPAGCPVPRTNLEYTALPQQPLTNLRGHEHGLSLDKHGMQIVRVPADVLQLDLANPDDVDSYMVRMAELLKQQLDATAVFCYNYKFRSSQPLAGTATPRASLGTHANPDTPAEAAHIDHTPQSARKRAKRHLTEDEATAYLNDHWRLRIVNVWKPLRVVHDHDLLFCDPSTVDPHDDLLVVDRASSAYAGEVYMLKPRTHYRWYWIKDQTPDEASIFVSYDSHCPRGSAPYCPHTSAQRKCDTRHPAPDAGEARESMELRMLVISAAAMCN
ncbi:hypothetical protein SCUCBS95973_008901 [Sporothrix curviconia]|uniref:Uncharacterized protein n=1 Tax=Sporothrix curviconia TaxID=1260050 RepID=A0ABP0CQD1_9PEZI